MTSNLDKILQNWKNPNNLISSLAAEVTEEARRRIEEPIRAELFTKAAEWLTADMMRLDADLARLSGDIQALVVELEGLKRAHAELEQAYHKAPGELKTMGRGQEVEQARRAVYAASERLNHLTNARQVTFVKRQETARALALVSKR